MKTKPLTDATTTAILDAAARLMVDEGRADPPLSEIAAAAGVSRQSVYLGFGGRAGLLGALLDRAARQSAAVARLEALSAEPVLHPRRILAVMEAWIDHLVQIHPVAALLDAAAIGDADAAVQARRFADRGRGYFFVHLTKPGGDWALRDGLTADGAADLVWSVVDARAWRGLVVERGWTEEAFRANRALLVRRLVLNRSG